MGHEQISPRVSIERRGGVLFVHLLPAQSSFERAGLDASAEDIVQQLVGDQPPQCVIDLSELKWVGSVDLALLVRLWKQVQSYGGECLFAGAGADVQNIISIAGLDRLWTLTDDREEALRTMQQRASAGWLRWVCRCLAAGGIVIAVLSLSLRPQEFARDLPHRALTTAGAAVGFLAGLMMLLREASVLRLLGLVVMLAAAATAWWEWGRPALPPPPGDEQTSSWIPDWNGPFETQPQPLAMAVALVEPSLRPDGST